MPSIIESIYKDLDMPRLYELPNLAFSLSELIDEVLLLFPEITFTPPVYFGKSIECAARI